MARVSSFELNNSVRATTPDNAIAELAKRQHGVIAYSQLLALGLDRNAVVYRVTVGRLHRMHKGVYAVGHAKVSWLGQVTAAVKACGAGAVISHRTAADLWGIRKTSSPRIEVTTTRRIRRPGIVVHQTRRLQDGERMRHEGIPVTAPGRTLDDLGRVLPPDQLQRAVEAAERLRLLDRATARSKAVIEAMDAFEPEALMSRSEWEAEFLDFCRYHGIPTPTLNAVVHGYEVDALWREQGLIVELDSWEFHKGRRSFEHDRQKRAYLKRKRFEVLNFTHRMLRDDAEESAATILEILTSVREVTR